MRKLLTFLIALGAIVFAVVSPVSANGVLFLARSGNQSANFAALNANQHSRYGF